MRAHSFLAQQHVFNPGYGVDRNYWKGHFVRELPDELIDELIERMMTLGGHPGSCCSSRCTARRKTPTGTARPSATVTPHSTSA